MTTQFNNPKTIKFNVLKRNRKYFAATTPKGAKCRIVIDANSENLELGMQELLAEDISVRSKYGCDLRFRLAQEAQAQKEAGVITLRHHTYNKNFVDVCSRLGGRYDKEACAWVFSEIVADAVEDIDCVYNSELVTVEITAKKDMYGEREPVRFLGYTLARAFGRDSGVELGFGVYHLGGSIASGGSVKNWTTKVAEGSRFRMQVPVALLEHLDSSNQDAWDIQKL